MSEANATIDEGAAEKIAEDVPQDATPVAKLAQRQGGIALAALSLFAAADAWHAATGLGFAALLSAINGAVVGYVIGSMAHEWGHFAGARWGGGIAPTKPIDSFFPIFTLDMERSDQRAFRWMGIGGNVGHWLWVVVLALFLPIDAVGRLALLAGAFAFAVAASTTEFPVLQRSYEGKTPAESFAGLTGEKLKRDRMIGAAAGVVLFLLF